MTKFLAATSGWVCRRPAVVVATSALLLRLGDLLLFALVAHRDGVSIPRLLRSWDGEWLYRSITEGWPSELPLDDGGNVATSTWAWPPLFSLLIRILASPFGRESISPTMIAVNVASSVGASVLLWLAIRKTGGNKLGVLVALVWASTPATPVFLMAYAEGLFLLFAFGALVFAGNGKTVAAGALLVLAGLTKSSVAPYAIALMVITLMNYRQQRLCGETSRALLRTIFSTTLAVVAISIWPAVAAFQLGSINAYALAQQPWSRSSIPGWDSIQLLWNTGTVSYEDPLMAFAFVTVAVIAAIAIAADQRFPAMVRLVAIFSPVFLIVVGAGMSTIRLLLPDVGLPAWLARLLASRPNIVAAIIGTSSLFMVMRFLWIANYVSFAIPVPPP